MHTHFTLNTFYKSLDRLIVFIMKMNSSTEHWFTFCGKAHTCQFRGNHIKDNILELMPARLTNKWHICGISLTCNEVPYTDFSVCYRLFEHTHCPCLWNPVNVVIISNWLRTSCISSANTSRMISIVAIEKCKKKTHSYELIFLMKIEVLFQNNSDKVHEAQWSDTEPLWHHPLNFLEMFTIWKLKAKFTQNWKSVHVLLTIKQCWASYSKNVKYFSWLITPFKIILLLCLLLSGNSN